MLPKILYRYRSMNETNYSAFVNDELYFSAANKFNDLREFDFTVDKDVLYNLIKGDLDKLDKSVRNKFIGSIKCSFLEDISIRLFFDIKELLEKEEVYQKYKNELVRIFALTSISITDSSSISSFYRIRERLISHLVFGLVEEDFYLSEAINDMVISSLYRYSRKRDYAFVAEYLISSLRTMLFDVFGVVCLTEEKDNHVMWGNYANSYNGFLLGYSVDDLVNQGVKIFEDQKLGTFHGQENMILSKVNYTAENKVDYTQYVFKHYQEIFREWKTIEEVDSKILDKLTLKNLFSKSLYWEYEKEFRIVRNSTGVKKIRPTEIYLGSKLSHIERAKLIDTALNYDIKCFAMQDSSNTDSFDISFREIPNYKKEFYLKLLEKQKIG